jgi:hypothetical protein
MMRPPLLETTLVRADRVRSFRVQPTSSVGWEASEREGHHIVQQQCHTDWHRVERTLERFGREIEELKQQGWRET